MSTPPWLVHAFELLIEETEERDKLDHASKVQKVLRMPEALAAIGKGQPLLRTDILSPCRNPDFFFKEKNPPRFSCEVSFFKNIDKESNSIRKPACVKS